jgi:cell division protein FtsB
VQRRTRQPAVAETPPPRHRTSLTSRAAILAIALCAVLLTLAVPLQSYIAQRAQIHDLAAHAASARHDVATLEHQRQQWHDPAYIKQQARVRLHYVEPGETAYVVIPPKRHVRRHVASVSRMVATSSHGPWYSRLWQSTVTAGTARPAK